MKIIYLASPYSSNPKRSCEVAAKAQRWAYGNCSPCVVLAPQLCLAASFDEATDRDRCMDVCLNMVSIATEVWYWTEEGGVMSKGVAQEVGEARARGIPIRSGQDVTRISLNG